MSPESLKTIKRTVPSLLLEESSQPSIRRLFRAGGQALGSRWLVRTEIERDGCLAKGKNARVVPPRVLEGIRWCGFCCSVRIVIRQFQQVHEEINDVLNQIDWQMELMRSVRPH